MSALEERRDALERKKKKDAEAEERRLRAEMKSKDLPPGTYRHSCWGCALHAGRIEDVRHALSCVGCVVLCLVSFIGCAVLALGLFVFGKAGCLSRGT